MQLCSRGHDYILPRVRTSRFKSTFVNRCLLTLSVIKQLLDEVEHDIMNYQNRGLCYLPQPSASADNTDTRF